MSPEHSQGFRPLIGVIISKRILAVIAMLSFALCFRPLIGVIISKRILAGTILSASFCFRPLIGVIISKPYPLTSPIE